MKTKEIVLVLGFPASGKTTETAKYIARGYDRLNRDLIGGSIADLAPRLDALIRHGSTGVVLDNLFPTPATRKPFIDIAQKYKVPITAVVMDTSIEDAQLNACFRMIKKYGKLLSPKEISASKIPNDIPPAVLFAYRKDYKAPSKAEGFDNILSGKFVRIYDPSYTNKALILDKDGTLTDCISGGKFPCTPDDVRALKGRTEMLQRFKDAGYHILGVSNQSGVAKGDLSEETLKDILAKTNELIGFDIEWLYCPHKVPPITCFCRKPSTGLLAVFIEKYKLHVKQSIFVGDSTSDRTCAHRAGMKFVDAEIFFSGKVQP